MRLFPFVLAMLALAAPARAQRAPDACRSAARALPTVPAVGVRVGAAVGRAPGAVRSAGPPCAARGESALADVLQEAWTGADWARVTRDRYEYDAADSLTLAATDVWDGAAWQPDALDTYAYTPEGRLAEHARRYWVGPEAINDFRERFTYGPTGLVTEYVYQIGTPGGYENSGRALPEYDAAGRLSAVLTQQWTGAAWADFARQTYAYDAAGRLAEETRADWDGAAFVPTQREIRAYDAATGALVLWTFQAWTGAAWTDTGRETYAVDAAGRTTEHVGESFESGAWVPILRDRFVYLAADGPEVTAAESRSWDAEAGAWGFGFREATAYDGARRPLSYTYQSVEGPGEAWDDVFRELYTVDAGGRRTERVVQESPEGAWVNVQQSLYAVDADGRLAVEFDNAWDGAAWGPSRRLTYRYEETVAGEPGAGPGSPGGAVSLTLTASPNPTRGALRVVFALGAPAEVTLDVFDALGRRVARLLAGAQPAGPQALTLDAGRLAPGVYTVRLVASGQTASRTVTVVR